MIEEKENGKKEREEEREKEKEKGRKERKLINKRMQEKIQSRLCKVALKLKKGREELELSMLVDCFAKALLCFLHGS